MSTVVERCPNCGVEHAPSHVGPCEVCGHELRYWCRRHSREIGWLSGPECALCRREAEEARTPPPPAAPPAPERDRPTRPHRPRGPVGPVERRPRPPVRAEDVLPHVAAGAGFALRMVSAVLVLVRTVLLWAVVGAVAGAGYAVLVGGELLWLAGFGLMGGGAVGFFLGILRAMVYLVRGGRRG